MAVGMMTREARRAVRVDFTGPDWDPIWQYQRQVLPEGTVQSAIQELVRLGLAEVKRDATLVNARVAVYRDLSRKVRLRMAIQLHELARELEAAGGEAAKGSPAGIVEGAIG